jgi:hypothetical protein
VTIRILPDANVLVSRTARDWILLIQRGDPRNVNDMFFLYYTVDTLAETINTIRNANPDLDGAKITTIHDRITESMTGRIDHYPGRADAPISDIGDHHVHAAAVAGGIDIVVTGDTGFTKLVDAVRDELPYEIQTPDEFLVLADDSWPEIVRAVTKTQFEYWTPKGGRNLPTALDKAGCTRFADRVRNHLQALYG